MKENGLSLTKLRYLNLNQYKKKCDIEKKYLLARTIPSFEFHTLKL